MIRLPAAVQEWFTLRRSVVVIVVVVGGFAWTAHRALRGQGGATSVLLFAPLGVLLLAPAIIGLLAGYVRWVRERTLLPWHGEYRAFDDHQIRVAEARDRLWFSSRDVHAALGLRRRDAVMRTLRLIECRDDEGLGEVLSNDGLVALFGRSTDRKTLRLIRWADGDVRRPWQKRRDGLVASSADRDPAPVPR